MQSCLAICRQCRVSACMQPAIGAKVLAQSSQAVWCFVQQTWLAEHSAHGTSVYELLGNFNRCQSAADAPPSAKKLPMKLKAMMTGLRVLNAAGSSRNENT